MTKRANDLRLVQTLAKLYAAISITLLGTLIVSTALFLTHYIATEKLEAIISSPDGASGLIGVARWAIRPVGEFDEPLYNIPNVALFMCESLLLFVIFYYLSCTISRFSRDSALLSLVIIGPFWNIFVPHGIFLVFTSSETMDFYGIVAMVFLIFMRFAPIPALNFLIFMIFAPFRGGFALLSYREFF